jgi:multidrug resistance efflux pump
MKKYLLYCLLAVCSVAKVHYAKVEPYESVTLKASVSGLVLEVDLQAEGTMVNGKRVIHLDDRLDRVNLEDTRHSVMLLEEMLKINEEIALSLAETVKRQKGYFERISKLSTASKTQKDTAYSTFSSAKTQYLGVKEKIISLKKQILDMKYRVAQLEDTIMKKSLVLSDKYLYKLMVKKGDFVAPGTPLARVDDARRAKLVLFLESEELREVSRKEVYLNGEKTDYKVDKVWRIADEKFISSYRAEIYIDAPRGHFSELIKVELK